MSLLNFEEIPISEIKIGKRLRNQIGNIDSLAKSIASIGLLQPIVITNDSYLIAGERRLSAVRQLGWTTIHVRRMDFKYGEK